MNLHEYQGKALLAKYGVRVPRNVMIEKAADAEKAARDLGTPIVVVKSQIHAGGRGAAHPVHHVGAGPSTGRARRFLTRFCRVAARAGGNPADPRPRSTVTRNRTWAAGPV
mgnify:CR=1 FL=1